ncbi:hypothetical protein Rsub_11340 [Raphidocelis subcapitata]|uniref:Pherophorin domain-containing protein n=1 Tax=Raphidocelis subcapitata TaxID=307507 RepID=A0A2V0PD88_9CHLO|nr:hypothetical protein Rsub_11340 [Raphidocelis subcapitata]|eukprot:GBF97814.1 hypothetical protein Rsub_11340 [Raphidocelis subcapitata]
MWNFTRQLWLAVLAALLASVSVDADSARSLLALSDCSAGTAGDIAPTSFRVAYTPGGPPPLECFQVVTDAPCDPAGDRCCLSAAGAPIKAPKFKWFVVEAPSQACLAPQALKLVK